MAFTLNHRPASILAVLATCIVVALGCREAEKIQTYTVPKEPKAVASTEVTASQSGEPTDRMLAAILPAGQQAWFFKVVGPIAEIDKHEKEIKDFFAGVGLAEDGRANWKLPAGWKEEAASQPRLATIVIPGDKRLEIAVSSASWPGTQESILANVNRWRGQLQLPNIGPQQLADVMHEAKAGERPITIVDMKGRFQAGAMTPPFAGGPFGKSAVGEGQKNANLPAGHPPIDASTARPGPAGAAPSRDVPKFEVPPTWKQVPALGIRKAEFALSEGEQKAAVTLIVFPANEGAMIADALSNINRWRGEIGLNPIEKDALSGVTQSIEVDGQPATFAHMVPDAGKPEESKVKEATLAAIVKQGNQVWFIKLRGDRELVTKHEGEFKSFVKSLKFSGDAGAGNGN